MNTVPDRISVQDKTTNFSKKRLLNLNSITFGFPAEIEQSFQDNYRVTTISTSRLGFFVAIMLYAAFGVLDAVVMPLSKNPIWVIRYAIVCPIFGFVILATYLPFFAKRLQFVMCFGAASAGLGIVAMIGISRKTELGHWYYMMGLLMVVIGIYGLLRLRFWYAVAANVIILVADEIVDVVIKQALTSSQGVKIFILHNFFFFGASIIGVFTGYALEAHARREYLQQRVIKAEREKSEKLLLNILPEKVAASLKEKEEVIAEEFKKTSVLFADIVNFTPLSSSLPPQIVVELLNTLFSHFDTLTDKHRVEKIKTIGDCYMVASGVPTPCPNHAHVLACLALDMLDYVKGQTFLNGLRFDLRIGINSGPLVAGIIGQRKFAYDLWGDTVNTASRMESHGSGGKIQISRATFELLGKDFVSESAGKIPIKGKGEMEVWYLLGKRPI
ncbi:MAG TPA: hypothetical protein DDX85_14115 [Nitrospiraceae bacterium]|nr:hypothetical protein [Nitrospiraceae bacterium]